MDRGNPDRDTRPTVAVLETETIPTIRLASSQLIATADGSGRRPLLVQRAVKICRLYGARRPIAHFPPHVRRVR